ncbi:MAG: S41 family peptidase [bacterium]
MNKKFCRIKNNISIFPYNILDLHPIRRIRAGGFRIGPLILSALLLLCACGNDRALREEIAGKIAANYFSAFDSREFLKKSSSEGIYAALAGAAPGTTLLSGDFTGRIKTGYLDICGAGLKFVHGIIGHEIAGVLPGSAAEAEGVSAGERLVKVNGRDALTLSREELQFVLRGPCNSVAIIETSKQSASGKSRSKQKYYLRRRPVPRHEGEMLLLKGGVAYLSPGMFNQAGTEKAGRFLAACRQNKAKALILDLRDTASQDWDSAAKLAWLFCGKDRCSLRAGGRNPAYEMTLEPAAPASFGYFRLAVLTDSRTTGAAELLAGALQSGRRARVFGERTAGLPFLYAVFPLKNGKILEIPVAEFSSGSKSWKEGVLPDVPCAASGPGRGARSFRDSVVRKAYEWLKE